MEKFITHTGVGVPLRRANVDTDQIIPAVYLKRVSRAGFADGLFSRWRADTDFVLNQAAYAQGSVLVAGQDFGTGSSREHAVWALMDYGFKVVLAPRFADIFRGNAGKSGLVAGVVAEWQIEQIWQILEAAPGTQITVDLPSETVRVADFNCKFEIDPYQKWRLLEGLDDIGITLREDAAITAFEAQREAYKPSTLPIF
ncbi:3-isopropylmalate dehydratase small subunit [Arcanobacterium hippocoleae]|nr:3-isopropylmalate dehydratase small subunit [Arcanobacterium hippocoleae]